MFLKNGKYVFIVFPRVDMPQIDCVGAKSYLNEMENEVTATFSNCSYSSKLSHSSNGNYRSAVEFELNNNL